MKRTITSPLALASTAALTASVEEARDEVGVSFERLCLLAGLASLTQMRRLWPGLGMRARLTSRDIAGAAPEAPLAFTAAR